MATVVDASAYIDEVQIALLERTPDVAAIIPHLQTQLEKKGITVNDTNRSAYAWRVTRLQKRNSPCSLEFTSVS